MNFRHKYLVNTIRILFGALLIFSGVSGFLLGPDAEGVPESMVQVNQVLWDTGIFQLIKTAEIVTGIMLLVGFLPALAAVMIAPLGVGVIVVNARLAPQFVISGVVVLVLNAYLGYAYWNQYRPMFVRKKK